jgi:hypothetical protein
MFEWNGDTWHARTPTCSDCVVAVEATAPLDFRSPLCPPTRRPSMPRERARDQPQAYRRPRGSAGASPLLVLPAPALATHSFSRPPLHTFLQANSPSCLLRAPTPSPASLRFAHPSAVALSGSVGRLASYQHGGDRDASHALRWLWPTPAASGPSPAPNPSSSPRPRRRHGAEALHLFPSLQTEETQ